MDDLDTQEGVYLVQQQLWALQVRDLGSTTQVTEGTVNVSPPSTHFIQMGIRSPGRVGPEVF